MLKGIVDWNKMKGNIDKQFIKNITECNRLYIPAGIYWISYAYNCDMARNEANSAVQTIQNYKIDLPIFFDFEYDSFNYAAK